MNLKAWEATIRQIADESNHEPKETGKYKIMTAWRRKLEREDATLSPHQIDEIVREVRKRLNAANKVGEHNERRQNVITDIWSRAV